MLHSHLANAQQLSARGNGQLRNMKIAMQNVQKDPKLFDGKRIVPGARMDEMDGYLQRTRSNLNRAIGILNQMSAADRGVPEVREVEAQILDMSTYVNDMNAAYQAAVKLDQERTAQCKLFQEEVMGSKTWREGMVNLIKAMQGEHYSAFFNRIEDLKKVRESVEFVKKACAEPKFKDVGKVGCNWLKIGNRRDNDPSAWCEVVGQVDDLLRKGVIEGIKFKDDIVSKTVIKADQLEFNKGWLQTDKFYTYKTLLFFGPLYTEWFTRDFSEHISLLGMEIDFNEGMLPKTVAAINALRAEVDRLAPILKI